MHFLKRISIIIPTYNEEENIMPLYTEITNIFKSTLTNYDYEILFIDNKSSDKTRNKISILCHKDLNVKAIFNAKNFGQFNSPFYGMLQSTGDCTILICADFQEPLSMIPKFIKEWENDYKIVIGVKSSSKESKLLYLLRSCYYKLIKKMSNIDQIEHFTGFGLYDKDFIDVLRKLDDPTPFLRGIVAELGFERKEIEYTQEKRRAGKTSNNFFRLYDASMLSITSYTKTAMRFATLLGFSVSMFSFIIAIVYLILKLIYWNDFPIGTVPLMISIFFLSAVQLLFIGIMGEYILSINIRTMKRPLVIEEKRINFDNTIQVIDEKKIIS